MNILTYETKDAVIYMMNTKELESGAVFAKQYASLSAARRKKVDSYRAERGRRQSLGAGILLAEGLRRYGVKENEVRMAVGGHGKPYLPDYPEIYFNLSHSAEMVMAAFSDREIGCDIEQLREPPMAVARRCFCPGEYEYIVRQSDEEKRKMAFYRLWTLKESFLKATGQGLRLSMKEFELAFGAETSDKENAFRKANISLRQSEDKYAYDFWECDLPGYRAAVCARAPE